MDTGRGFLSSASGASRKSFSGWPSIGLGSRSTIGRPPGLGNLDNSCYQNSILQGLASLQPLPAYLSAVSQQRPGLSPTQTVDTLRDLIADLTNPSSDGRTLWTPRVLKNMSTWQQQDAQEYYSKLLDQIDTEIAKASRAILASPTLEPERSDRDSSVSRASHDSDDSGYHSMISHSRSSSEARLALRNPLEGLIAQRVACVRCGYCEGLTMIPFNCLTLTLGDLPQHDLYERLDHYTKVEPIENVECPKCTLLMCRNLVQSVIARTGMLPEFEQRLKAIDEALEDDLFDEETLSKKCNISAKMRVSSTKTKQVALARPPQSLVFHINRSAFDERTGYLYKNSAAVRFPMLLDIGPWCLGSANGRAKDLKEGSAATQDVEQWTLDPKASMVAGDRGPSRVTGPIYELRAVVTHQGHHENGHYVCYRRHPIPPSPRQTANDNEGSDEKDMGSLFDEVESKNETVSDDATGTVHEGEESRSTPSQDEQKFQWWRLSDEDAYAVDEQTVLAQGGVFMLFYDCVDHNAVLVDDEEETQVSVVEQAPQETQGPAEVAVETSPSNSQDPAQTEEPSPAQPEPMEVDEVVPPPVAAPDPGIDETASTGEGQREVVETQQPAAVVAPSPEPQTQKAEETVLPGPAASSKSESEPKPEPKIAPAEEIAREDVRPSSPATSPPPSPGMREDQAQTQTMVSSMATGAGPSETVLSAPSSSSSLPEASRV
jgi:ubiquitin carboxyl-terminal hydrolase 1